MRPNRAAVRRALAPDVFEAFRELVYSYGVQKLAPKMGLRPGTLYNKADASEDTTPPVTKTNLVIACGTLVASAVVVKRDYRRAPGSSISTRRPPSGESARRSSP